MTEQKQEIAHSPEQAEQINALNAVRQSLLNTAFQHYHTLMNFLKSLPIGHAKASPGWNYAMLQIDSGMLFIKEILPNSPIIFPETPAQNDEPIKEVQQEIDPA